MTTSIPVPPRVPVLGHALAFVKDMPIRQLEKFADEHGEIYELQFPGGKMNVVSSVALVGDVSNDRKFSKNVGGPLSFIRRLGGDGLFTARKDEQNWGIAHRILMPNFRTIAIRDMFPDMLDIASQLVLKWERFGPQYRIHLTDDFTRLSLDTLALCSMSYRVNSFYMEENHPFVVAMSEFLEECDLRPRRPPVVNQMMTATTAKFEYNMTVMRDIAREIIIDRKKTPTDKKDLLNAMLHQKDPKTGLPMEDEVIMKNLLTFLIAGHETTAGMLSFCIYYLIKHPECMKRAQEEVDDLLGDHQVQLEDLSKLPYLTAVMRETLRLGPPLPWRQVFANEDTTIGGGKYFIPKRRMIVVLTQKAQRDRDVWGEDADLFRPERMLDGKFEAMPHGAWQPFGFGARVCIGRPFAWQEGLLALAMMFQKFDFELADPEYDLQIRQTLTLRPNHLYVHAIPRARCLPTKSGRESPA